MLESLNLSCCLWNGSIPQYDFGHAVEAHQHKHTCQQIVQSASIHLEFGMQSHKVVTMWEVMSHWSAEWHRSNLLKQFLTLLASGFCYRQKDHIYATEATIRKAGNNTCRCRCCLLVPRWCCTGSIVWIAFILLNFSFDSFYFVIY